MICPYATYQRATSGFKVRQLTAKEVIRLVRQKIRPQHRRVRAMRGHRHEFYRTAVQHWRYDLQLVRDFKL